MADDNKGEKAFRRWLSEIQNAQKDIKYRTWLLKCEKIIRRYRDERSDTLSSANSTKRLVPLSMAKNPSP